MAWCENEKCNKNGLRKSDVEFCDTTRKVLCHGCYLMVHPGWIPPYEFVDLTNEAVRAVRTPTAPQLGYAIQMSDQEGIKAQVSYGDISISLHIPNSEVTRFLKG